MSTLAFLLIIGYLLLKRLFSRYAEELYFTTEGLDIKIGSKRNIINFDMIRTTDYIQHIIFKKVGIIILKFNNKTELGSWIFFWSSWWKEESVYDSLINKLKEN